MKIAYRIITPILAVGAVLMGFFLKLFYFAIGTADESLSSIVQLVGALGVKTTYEFWRSTLQSIPVDFVL